MQVDIPVMFLLLQNENLKGREQENLYPQGSYTGESPEEQNLTNADQKRGRNKYKGNYGIKG